MTTAAATKHSIGVSELGKASFRDWLFVDVRTPGEYQGMHIEGSLSTPLGGLKQLAPEIREQAAGKDVALICRTGHRAEEARRILRGEGLERLRILEGGILAWERASLPLLRGVQSMSLERQVRVAAGALVVLGVLLGFLIHPVFFGLSAFVGAGLMFAGLTDTCGMAMMLAKMPWNRGPVACSTK